MSIAFWRRSPKPPVEREDDGALTLLTVDPPWWDSPVFGLSEEEQAARRWTAINAAARAAGCKCGKPATHVERDHRNLGHVPVERWTCDEHVGVMTWTSDGSGHWQPAVD